MEATKNKSKRERPDMPAEGEIRKTYLVNEDMANKIGWIAYWDRLKIKNVLNTAISEYITKYEKKNGSVKPPPTT